MFPVDPNAPGGPERSEYLRRGYVDRVPLNEQFPTLNGRRQAKPRPAPSARAV